MYGEWWIKFLERKAVEEKIGNFIAELDPDERLIFDSIMRERFGVPGRESALSLALAQQRMDAQRPLSQLQQATNCRIGSAPPSPFSVFGGLI